MNSTQLTHIKHFIPTIREYDANLEKQNLWWSVVSMVGKVNNEGMEGQLLESISNTQIQFDKLRTTLIDSMVQRYLDKVEADLSLKSKAFINTLNRNLFERTADVGFLATDDDLVSFLESGETSRPVVQAIEQRLEAYVKKYSVYDDVVILTPSLEIAARLQSDIGQTRSNDPVFRQALETNDYVEYEQAIDIFPHTQLPLFYIQKILNKAGQVIGILCLSFKFQDELTQISNDIESTNADTVGRLVLLNEQNQALFGCSVSPTPSVFSDLPLNHFKLIDLNSEKYFVYASQAEGYQGFKGMPWKSVALLPLKKAFKPFKEEMFRNLNSESALFPADLHELNLEINTALLIVILNGKIISIKNKVKAFLPILDSFQQIGTDISQTFKDSIGHIYQVGYQTMTAEVQFMAKLAMDIMDRNLYERANDCRWWALNAQFSETLSKGAITSEDQTQLTQTLDYINELYTVYTHLFIYNRHGEIIAISNSSDRQDLLNLNVLSFSGVKESLSVLDSQQYRVSNFEPSPLYDDQPTYIYYAPIRHQNGAENVGGIGVVFDSEPEFEAILTAFLPQNREGKQIEGSFAAFIDAQGKVISMTPNSVIRMGETLSYLSAQMTEKNASFLMEIGGTEYLVGYQSSQGYREYKVSDGYENQLTALIFIRA